jgi:hypothetical protein
MNRDAAEEVYEHRETEHLAKTADVNTPLHK